MPGIADTPSIDLYFDEDGFDHAHGQSVGIGEVATVPTSATIANAIYNAIGVHPTASPSIPAPAAHLTPRRSRRRSWRMTRRSQHNQRPALTTEQLLGDGSNGAADHALNVDEMIEAIERRRRRHVNAPLTSTQFGARAELALVAVVARVVASEGAFRLVRLAAGGVAPVPIRPDAAEAAAQGAPVSPATITPAARAATQGAKPPPMTAYKLDLLSGLVQDLLQ